MLEPGTRLKITSDNSLYRGEFSSKIISTENRNIVISAPVQNDRSVLLPVGNMIMVEAPDAELQPFQAEILDRAFKPQRILIITGPDSIARKRNPASSIPATEAPAPGRPASVNPGANAANSEISGPDTSSPGAQAIESIAPESPAPRAPATSAPASGQAGPSRQASPGKTEHPYAGEPGHIQRNLSKPGSRVIAVTSGKGGVGKTTISINMSLALARLGNKVCLIDVDLGTANVDFLLNLKAEYNIAHLITGDREMEEILVEGPEGLLVLPGSSGLEQLANLSEWQFSRLVNSFNQLDQLCDIVVLDTGAGISANVTNFLLAADEVILVTTPDPHALLDAYALIKTIHSMRGRFAVRLIVNRVEKQGDEARVKLNLLNTCQAHLHQPIEYLGLLPESRIISNSVRTLRPFVLEYPETERANAALMRIAHRIEGSPPPEIAQGESGLSRFISQLQKLFGAGT